MNSELYVELKEGAAIDDAKQIKSIVQGLRENTEVLQKIVNDLVGGDVVAEFAENLKDDLNNFANTRMEEVYSGISLGAQSLENAVKATIEYNTNAIN